MKILMVLAMLAVPLMATALEWSGTVVGVSDGDTLTVLTAEKRQVKIRLAEIDAPESKQAFGTQSKKSLSDLCFKKFVAVNDKGTDRYRRTIGRVRCDGVDANAEQVRQGMAWAYRDYLTDQSIAELEAEAKSAKRGLWGDAHPTPPWEFRHGGQSAKTAKKPIEKSGSSRSFECGGKTTCGQMSSCGEANFYLSQCGLGRLDRDHDGVPCESICK